MKRVIAYFIINLLITTLSIACNKAQKDSEHNSYELYSGENKEPNRVMDDTISFLNKPIIFGSSEQTIRSSFKGFEGPALSLDISEMKAYSLTFLNIDANRGESPLDMNFYFFNDKLFKLELIEYYTAEGPDPNYKKYKRITVSLNDLIKQFDKNNDYDTLGLIVSSYTKNKLRGMSFSEDAGVFVCFDKDILNEIKQAHPDFDSEYPNYDSDQLKLFFKYHFQF